MYLCIYLNTMQKETKVSKTDGQLEATSNKQQVV
jgi:hypothetical protein